MSEEKIIQHSQNALHVLQDKKLGWFKKLKEFFYEILIIFFAVSLTLILHNWNDGRHERHIAKEFLEGIKLDLDSGAADLQENMAWFQTSIDYYTNVRQQITSHQYNTAYLDSNSWSIVNTMYFNFDMGRFEAFKSSGYLRLIHNQALLKRLMNLYTIVIPFQIQIDRTMFDTRKRDYDTQIGPRAKLINAGPRDGRIMVSQLIDDPQFQYFIINYEGSLTEKKKQKEDLIKEMKAISAEIAEELD